MTKATLIRTATSAALIVMTLLGPADAGHRRRPIARQGRCAGPVQIYGDKAAQFIPLGVSKSIVVDLPGDIKDVLVADPKIANAVVRTARRAYIIGVAVGQTNVYFFDAEGKQLMAFDIAVTRDLNGMRAALKRALPDCDIAVEGLADGIMLTGSVASPAEFAAGLRSRRPARRRRRQGRQRHHRPRPRPGDAQGHRRRGPARRHQAARHRSQRPRLAAAQGSEFHQQQPVPGGRPGAGQFQRHHRDVSRRQRFAARDGACRRHPHAGGAESDGDLGRVRDLPGRRRIPGSRRLHLHAGRGGGQVGNCQYQIQWKKFGIGLNFTPVVMSEGRISLKVLTEASELSTDNQLT